MYKDTIAIIDYGSQYTQLIARRVRELNVYSIILPYNFQPAVLNKYTIKGIILSGGPSSVYDNKSPKLNRDIFPFVANTHTETSTTGATMSLAFHEATHIIKKHIGANEEDVLISAGAGMTMLVSKFQRILGLKIHEKYQDKIEIEILII